MSTSEVRLGALKSKLKWSEAKVKSEDDTGAEAKFEVLEPEAAEDLWGLSNSKMLELGAGDESEGFVKWNGGVQYWG